MVSFFFCRSKIFTKYITPMLVPQWPAPLETASPLKMPPFDIQQPHRLDKCSPESPDYPSGIFHGQGYVASLEDGDSVWFVEYLDQVSLHITLIDSPPTLA